MINGLRSVDALRRGRLVAVVIKGLAYIGLVLDLNGLPKEGKELVVGFLADLGVDPVILDIHETIIRGGVAYLCGNALAVAKGVTVDAAHIDDRNLTRRGISDGCRLDSAGDCAIAGREADGGVFAGFFLNNRRR